VSQNDIIVEAIGTTLTSKDHLLIEGILAIILFPVSLLVLDMAVGFILLPYILHIFQPINPPCCELTPPHSLIVTSFISVLLVLEIVSLASYIVVKLYRLKRSEDTIIEPSVDGLFITMIITASISLALTTIIIKAPLLDITSLLTLLAITGVPIFGITTYSMKKGLI